MADRYLLESGGTDGYLLEDGSGVLILEESLTLEDATTSSGVLAPIRVSVLRNRTKKG